MELVGVGLAFATVPFLAVAFTPLGRSFAELDVLDACAELTAVSGTVLVGLVRGILTGVAVGFETLDAVSNNPVVTQGVVCVAVFTCGPFA